VQQQTTAKVVVRLFLCSAALVLLVMFSTHAAAAPEDWLFGVNFTTDRINRGWDESDGRPSLGATVDWYPGSGFFAEAAAWSAKPFSIEPLGAEFKDTVGYAWPLSDDWSLSTMLSHYQFLHEFNASRLEYDELALTGGWRNCLFASVTASPNTAYRSPKTRAYSYNLSGHLPLTHGFSAIAAVGYYDLSAGLGAGYVYGNVGLGYQYRNVDFQISYFDTRAPSSLIQLVGAELVHRWVAQLSVHF